MKASLPILAVMVLTATACHSQKRSATSIQTSIAASNEEVDKDAGAPLNMDSVGTLHQSCPSDMVEIEGEYCSKLETKCLYNVDADGKRMPGPGNPLWSCGEYASPAICSGPKVHMHFCIDRFEYPNKEGQLPQDWMSWFDVKRGCESIGKRLCTAKEWTLAAEGPHMHPLPYGDGYHRDNRICNFDRHYSDIYKIPEFQALGLKGIDVFQSKRPDDKMSQALRLFLVPSGSMPDCHSDYGVHDMAGNLDEEVYNEDGTACLNKTTGNCISGLKGGHVWHVRNASRPMTTIHGETFSWYETSGRCCSNASK